MKLILCCNKEAGLNVLKHVLKYLKYDKLYIYTNEDSSIISHCVKNSIDYSTEKITVDNLPFKPDIISSVYYNYIISKDVIKSCNGKIFNSHPSALPKHKGCSSVPWAMIDGDSITALTYHYINDKIDDGNIILQSVIHILPEDTQLSLYKKCMDKAAELWPAAFMLVHSGFSGVEQEPEPKSYHKRGCPHGGEIDDSWDDDKIKRFIKAMYYPPLPPARYKGKDILKFEDYLKAIGYI